MGFITDCFERHAMRKHLKHEMLSPRWKGVEVIEFRPITRDEHGQNPRAEFFGVVAGGNARGLEIEGAITHKAEGTFETKWDVGHVHRNLSYLDGRPVPVSTANGTSGSDLR